ncbi:MAG: helicase-associated domain-containing protein [Chloroflexi bacterium]|nr:helicase-associated domain-containing protein [Chloroflexota bacterium]
MPRVELSTPTVIPDLEQSLAGMTVEMLKRYAAVLGKPPTRKAELTNMLLQALTDPAEVRRLWQRLTPLQQTVVAEVVHTFGGIYDDQAIKAKYPGASAPEWIGYGSFARTKSATPFDILFFHSTDAGMYIPTDLAALLRTFAPRPPVTQMRARSGPPSSQEFATLRGPPPAVVVAETERAVFHDLAATLLLIQQGRIGVSPATSLPTLTSVRRLREHLLTGDFFPEAAYERAEDAIRPLALVVLVQAAKWAVVAGPSGGKLQLTRAGQGRIAGPPQPSHIREVWEYWLKSDLVDELSRIRTIKGQQSRRVRLTRPSSRREKLVVALRSCPIGRWVDLDEFFRFMRAERLSPEIERTVDSGLSIGDIEYGWLGYRGVNYWDIVVGSCLRAVLWEYVATLGLIEIAYTRPEESPRDFGEAYGLEDYEYLSRYDGLLAFRLTNLGAYVLGLTSAYTPPIPVAEQGPPLLKVLPNLDLVVADATRLTPGDRAFLDRVATARSENVYRLSRDRLLDAAEHGLGIPQIVAFLAGKSGVAESELPQTVRVFLADVEKRLDALREAGRAVMLESQDPYVLIELAHTTPLRGMVRLATVDDRPVLLVPEDKESAVRKQLKKLGYLPRK